MDSLSSIDVDILLIPIDMLILLSSMGIDISIIPVGMLISLS